MKKISFLLYFEINQHRCVSMYLINHMITTETKSPSQLPSQVPSYNVITLIKC